MDDIIREFPGCLYDDHGDVLGPDETHKEMVRYDLAEKWEDALIMAKHLRMLAFRGYVPEGRDCKTFYSHVCSIITTYEARIGMRDYPGLE